MFLSSRHSLFVLGIMTACLPVFALAGADNSATTPARSAASIQKFDQAVDRIESMQLPLNKVFLYRQAAVALASSDKPRAIQLLKQALADIDAAEAALKAQQIQDDKLLEQLEFHRMPVYMLMERIDPAEALNAVSAPQTADHDTAFFALFFSRLVDKSPDQVLETAQRKLSYGASPAVVAAYDVLKSREPGPARTLATQLIMKLAKTDPADDPVAVQAAFGLLRLLRTDAGSLAPNMILDPTLLSPESVHDLFTFIGDAFLTSKDPEMLILGQRPSLFVDAMQVYAPDKAQEVKMLPFAAPGAKSLIFSPETPVYDANHPDPAKLTPEEAQARAAMKARIEAQMKETDAGMKLLEAKIKDPAIKQKDRDDAVFALVDQANRVLSLARAGSTVLNRESFRNGEVEFYSMGPVTGVVDSVSSILQTYAAANPRVAEAASQNLDGPEVQAEVALQIAIHEMTGSPAYLVIQPPKPPAGQSHPAAAKPAPAGQAAYPGGPVAAAPAQH